MKRRWRHSSAAPSAGGPAHGDGLDDEIWTRLSAILAAGNRGDADRLASLWLSLERQVSDHQRDLAGVYVWYLLEYRVLHILRHRATPDDLQDLASRNYPKFARLIKENEISLYDTLCTVFRFAPPERQIGGTRLFVSGSAAVSVLLDNPPDELPAIRPHLANWYHRHAGKLQELGMTAPPRSAP
jgi:hypothetical protein